MKTTVYRQLLRINRGFDAVLRGLTVLGKRGRFPRSELRGYSALVREARAATNSYLAGAIESAEAGEAGQLFRQRLAKERKEESG